MATSTETRRRRRSSHHSSIGDFMSPTHTPTLLRTRSRSQQTTASGSADIMFDDQFGTVKPSDSSLWHDAPLVVAILPCLGAFIFGTDYLQDIILLVCVGWYLHTCIRLPWSLYELSRPRTMPKHARDKMTPEQRHAENTLEWRSFMLLGIAFVAPFAGLWLMRWILQSAGAADGGPYITYFHGTLFVLFGGVRPINHLAALVAGSTRELHGRVHHPPLKDEVEQDLELKVEKMEMLLAMLTEKLREQESFKMEDTTLKKQGMLEVQDNFEKTAARLEDGARRREKKAEIALEMMQRRLEGLEKQCEGLLSITLKEKEAAKQAEPTLRGLILKWLDWIETFFRIGQRRDASQSPNGYHSPTSSRRLATNGNSNSRGSTSGTVTSLLPRRRSSEGAGPINLDTVVEEGPEVEGEADPAQGGDHGMIDLLDGNGPELTMPAHGVRKRTKLTGLDNQSSSTANAATGSNSGSQFLRIPAEGSRHGRKIG